MVLCASLDLFNTISNSFRPFYCSGPAVADSVVVVVIVGGIVLPPWWGSIVVGGGIALSLLAG